MNAAFHLPHSAYRILPQFDLSFGDDEIFVDNFAGWGGASVGIEEAIGQPVDIAINHSKIAIEMHKVNHPRTLHLCEDVFEVDPVEAVAGRPVGGAWFSPDCTHFSNAKGGTPVDKKVRGLAWVAVRWAARVKPRVIWLENVREFMTWGRLMQKRDAAGNLVFRNDGGPWMVPDPAHKGEYFRMFVARLERLGYKVEFKVLTVSDYGVGTIRKRFFLIARRDGQSITWPTPDHADPKRKDFRKLGRKRWIPVHKFIDFSRPCHSIFLTKEEGSAVGVKRPLAENTMARIARGIRKYVYENPKPFIVRIGQQGFGGDGMQYSTDDTLTTVVTKQEHCLVMPHLSKYYGPRRTSAETRGSSMEEPIHTIPTENRHALVLAFLAKHYGGNYDGAGADMREPLPGTTTKDHNALITSHIVKLRGTNTGHAADDTLHTISAQGTHLGEVRAFLFKYYSKGENVAPMGEPLPTCTGKDRIGLVLVKGELYQIVDICMRMLDPDELFAASSFPKNYIIDTDSRGRRVPKYVQTAGVGNSVPPLMARKLVAANYTPMRRRQEAA